jgi:RND family efflux transporter MFP subunit
MKSGKIKFYMTVIAGLLIAACLTGNAQEFTGAVAEFVKNDSPVTYMKFGMDGMKGRITWVISPGTYVKGPIYDAKGNIVRKGQLLATVDDRFYKYDVTSAEGELLKAKGILKDAESEFRRQADLVKKKAVKKKDLDQAEAALISAQGNYKDAKAKLEYSKFIVGLCELRAPFDGYVQEVFTRRGGWSNIDYPTLKLIRLNPLYVDVKMDRKLAREILYGKKTVSIQTDAADKLVGTYNTESILTKSGIRLPITNYILPSKESNIPVVNYLCITYRFYQDSTVSKPLAVPETCIFKDSKGSYVWQAVGQEGMQANKAIATKFQIKKVYVKIGDRTRSGAFITKMVLLKDCGSLEENDILISNPNLVKYNFKDGETVVYEKIHTLFWPGDKVVVKVQ